MHGWHRILPLCLVGALALTRCASPNATGSPHAPRTAAATVAHPNTTTTALEREVHELVNRYRKAHGLPPLALDAHISEQARLHSVAMATGTTPLGHQGFENRVRALTQVMPCRRSAENVGFNEGYDDPASQAVQGWRASRTHREDIEGPYDLTGVGVAGNAAGEVYFTQMFVGR